jgi:leucyl/phenylalanyl-tRNA--protein transferase
MPVREIIAGGKSLPDSDWVFPDPLQADPNTDVIALGADLHPATVLQGYAQGLFPMYLSSEERTGQSQLAWWSPNPRGILPLEAFRLHRSLRKSRGRFVVTCDTRFTDVMYSCQRPTEDGQWITRDFIETYSHLHQLGYAHSVEVWNRSGELVGGLYGIELGGLFAGESMFSRERDASKVALLFLVEKLRACGGNRILDVQWRTEHLASLGVVEIPRTDYVHRLHKVLHTSPCFG